MKAFSAPGRVNLIGEHTDYTGGLVLPIAIPFYTEAEITAGESGYRFSSEGFGLERHMTVDDRSGRLGQWSDYPVGVLRELQALGIDPPPFALRLKSNVPLSAGLSSSASVEVATAVALLAHSRRSMSGKEIALLCQRAENRYVGSPCGIMDQFIVTAGEKGHALLIQTRDLEAEQLPMNAGALAGTRVVIVNSNVKHSVAEGEYGVRRKELERGQDVLRKRASGAARSGRRHHRTAAGLRGRNRSPGLQAVPARSDRKCPCARGAGGHAGGRSGEAGEGSAGGACELSR